MYDLVVRGGTVIDPAQGINETMDVAVSRGRVDSIRPRIAEGSAKKVIDAAGMIVTPGLIDLHTHTAYNLVKLSVDPEEACLLRGTTTVVDAGSTGELNFTPFKKFVIDPARPRILAFINIESLGMVEFTPDPPKNTDQAWPDLITGLDEAFARFFVNLDNTVRLIRKNRHTIVGIKWAHHGRRILELARTAADRAGCPLMIENHFMPEAMKYLRKGDIITHLYHNYRNPRAGYVDGLTDHGKVRPEFHKAVKSGIILDVGHGKGSFVWKVAELGFREGVTPHTISTDLWIANLNGPVYDLPTTMSKFLHLGMSLEEVVRASTAAPASAVGRLGEIGTLKHGAVADMAVFKLRHGRFPLVDVAGGRRTASRLLTPVHVVRGGRVVLSGGEPAY